jgi:peptide methionine sulfoxide reductase msrA/msrB
VNLHRIILVCVLVPAAIVGIRSEGMGQSKQSGKGSNTVESSVKKDAKAMMTWNEVLRYARNGNPAPARRVEKADDEWRKILTREQYAIARAKGTERAHTGEYCSSHEPGVYACVCCRTVLFDSRMKFESGTGWPSFTQPAAPNVISYHDDSSYGMERIEVLCSVCDAHLGHVFPDGPGDGGLRYCINSASLVRIKSQ